MMAVQQSVVGLCLWAALVAMQGLWWLQASRPQRLISRLHNGRILLGLSILLHLGMLVSLDADWFDPLGMEPANTGPGHDFGAVYYAGKAVADGGSPYDRSYGHTTAYRYLPFPGVVFAFTLSLFRFKVAYWLWVLIGELGLLTFLRWLYRRHPESPRQLWAVGTILIAYPLYGGFHAGQFDLCMGLLLAVAAILLLEERDRSAMWVWILSVLTKLYSLALIYPLLLRRRFRWVLVALAVTLALSLPWMLRWHDGGLSGAEGIEHFLRNVRQKDYIWLGHTGARHLVYLSIRRTLEALGEPDFARRAARSVSLFYAFAVVALSAIKSWRRRRSWSLADDLFLWALTFFLVAGDVWVFSYLALLPLLALRGVGERSLPILSGLALMALPTAWVFVALARPDAYGHEYQLGPLAEITFRSFHALGLAIVYLWVLRSRGPVLTRSWVDRAAARDYS